MDADYAAHAWAERIGRPRETNIREVVNVLLYSLVAWCLPAFAEGLSTVFWRRCDENLLRTIRNELVMAAREREGRQAAEYGVDAARRITGPKAPHRR